MKYANRVTTTIVDYKEGIAIKTKCEILNENKI